MTTAAREYTTIDKSEWPRGPWDREPDKVQWVDKATDLDCLIVRGPSGALCGYVGVADGHRLFGVGYNECTQKPACGEAWCGHTPESGFSVHGGLTFADSCHEPTEEDWLQIEAKAAAPELLAEAVEYPKGDSAERLRELRSQSGLTWGEWEAYQQARRICHIPEPGRPTKVFWFGFDCAHSGDRTPKFERDRYRYGEAFMDRASVYRDRAYVEGQCVKLAEQLKAVA